jgi:mono/diheme cytochrome c family protein
MTNSTTRIQPAALTKTARATRAGLRHRVISIATLAALFSLFALYIAWLEVHRAEAPPEDDSPFAQAVARGPALPGSVSGGDIVKRGEYLARAGACLSCHTADKSRPFAGGVALRTPFGTIYTPNLTPDAATGIGQWSDDDFLRAMHEGIGRTGERLYPAFPYTAYTKLADRDVLAIRAYLKTLTPIHSVPPPNQLVFPFGQRGLMLFWNLFNFNEGRFVPDPKQSPEWNRGAYLVEGLGHGRTHAAAPVVPALHDDALLLSREDLRSIAVYLRSLPSSQGGARVLHEPRGASDSAATLGSAQ